MTTHKALYARDDVDRLYVSRKEEEEDLPALNTVLTHFKRQTKEIAQMK